jgi:hypothetical protein
VPWFQPRSAVEILALELRARELSEPRRVLGMISVMEPVRMLSGKVRHLEAEEAPAFARSGTNLPPMPTRQLQRFEDGGLQLAYFSMSYVSSPSLEVCRILSKSYPPYERWSTSKGVGADYLRHLPAGYRKAPILRRQKRLKGLKRAESSNPRIPWFLATRCGERDQTRQ